MIENNEQFIGVLTNALENIMHEMIIAMLMDNLSAPFETCETMDDLKGLEELSLKAIDRLFDRQKFWIEHERKKAEIVASIIGENK